MHVHIRKNIVYRVQYYPLLQASTGDLGIYSLHIREAAVFALASHYCCRENYHKLSSLKYTNVLSYGSGGQK